MTSPLFYQSYIDSVFPRGPVEDQLLGKLGHLTCENRSKIPSAGSFGLLGNTSLAARIFPDAIETFSPQKGISLGGAPLVGLLSFLYIVIGLGWARDSYKQMKNFERMGDPERASHARMQICENLALSLASAGEAGSRAVEIGQEIIEAWREGATLSHSAIIAQTGFVWFSTVFYLVYFAAYCYRCSHQLFGLVKGDALRERLLGEIHPIETLRSEWKKGSLEKLGDLSRQQLIEIALDEGALWLRKVEKEAIKSGVPISWNTDIASRRESARNLFLMHPEIMIGEMQEDLGLSPEQKMVMFGSMMAIKRLSAQAETHFVELLGKEAVEAVKKDNAAQFKEALEKTSWNHWGPKWEISLKIALTLVAAAATIGGAVLSGGTLLGVLLLLLGASGVVWIIVSDRSEFVETWSSPEVKKRDYGLIYLSTILSLLSVVGLITLSVFTGGVWFYAIALILSVSWLFINAGTLGKMVGHDLRPWDYMKQVSAEMFLKLMETRPDEKKREAIFARMSLFDQRGVQSMFADDWKKAAEAWARHLEIIKKQNLQELAFLL